MATTIITKFGSGAPAASDVVRGELAVDTENKRLYTEDSGGSVVELGTNPAANVTFGDNVKAVFGAGSDLQIYHDSNNSYIKDAGTGNLYINANELRIGNADNSKDYIHGNNGAEVKLYYNNASKLATTSSGIDVTGTVTADSALIGRTSTSYSGVDLHVGDTSDNQNGIQIQTSTTGYGYVLFGDGTGADAYRGQLFYKHDDDYMAMHTAGSERLRIDSSGRLLINKTSATGNLSLESQAPTGFSVGSGFYSASTQSTIEFQDSNTTANYKVRIGSQTDDMVMFAGGSERMRIDSSGNVGIGTSSPASELHVKGSTPDLRVENTTASETVSLSLIKTATKGFSINNKEISGTNYLTFNLDTAGAGTDALIIHPTDGSVSTPTAGTSNLRLGVNAGNSIASGGNYNVVLGDEAGTAITTGDANVAVGYKALFTEDANGHNTAVGYLALTTLNAGADARNTAVGFKAGELTSLGVQNTFIGSSAGGINTSGSYNVFIGDSAADANTTGESNVAIGQNALTNNNGNSNVAVGRQAMQTSTSGEKNIAIGHFALYNSTSADNNVAIGYQAGQSITTGPYNTFVGTIAGNAVQTTDQNTLMGYGSGRLLTGASNAAIGAFSLYDATSASHNTALGTAALYELTEGDQNTAVGRDALRESTSATNNTAVGYSSGRNITTGNRNVVIGQSVANSLQDGSDNVAIGDSVNVAASLGNSITIGSGISATGSNDFSFGKASNVVTNDFDADANWSRSSDERLKKNISDQTLGLSFINDLRTVKYNWKANHELDPSDSQLAHLYKADPADNEMNTAVTMHNFIAQEVKAALDTAGVSDFGGWKEDQYGVQQVSREMFVIPLVKAVQELSAKVDALTARIEALESN